MKILFLTSRFPYPLEKGDKLRAFHQMRVLAAQHEVILMSIIDETPAPEAVEHVLPFTHGLYLLTVRPVDRFFSMLSAFLNGMPFQVAWFYSKALRKKLNAVVSELKPDHIYCQLPRMAEYALDLKIPKTIDYMDSFGLGMIRRSTVASWPVSWLYKWEAKRMIRYEEQISHQFDHLTIISQQDKDSFRFPEAAGMHVVQNGIDDSFYQSEEESKAEFDLVFIGNLSYLPNVETAEFIVRKILPLCPSDTRILLSGASPDSRVLHLQQDRVKVQGWTEDIRKAYRSGRVFMAPMWAGTGQQNKILEAMALGIPCITTPLVNNAIGATPEKEILIANSPESFAECFQRLISDPEFYQRLQLNATNFVKQHYKWEQNVQLLSSIFSTIEKHEFSESSHK